MTIQYFDDGDVACFNGLSFRKDKKTGYYLNAKTHKRLHVYVWEYYNGKVPRNYHVHHKDFDKSNNEIDNLVLLSAQEHLSLHGRSWNNDRYEKAIRNLDINVRPKASEWHGSESGRIWHKEHYEKMKDSLYQKNEFICENCGKTFIAINHGKNKFCSNACKSAARRKSGIDNEIRKCEWCGKEYSVNKYSKSKTCSRTCRNFLRWDQINSENRL